MWGFFFYVLFPHPKKKNRFVILKLLGFTKKKKRGRTEREKENKLKRTNKGPTEAGGWRGHAEERERQTERHRIHPRP